MSTSSEFDTPAGIDVPAQTPDERRADLLAALEALDES